MASELIVQTIQGPSSGANANKVLIPSGHTLDVSGGTLTPSSGQSVQLLQAKDTTQATYATSVWNQTPLYLDITPKLSGSKFYLNVNVGVSGDQGGAEGVGCKVQRQINLGASSDADGRHPNNWGSHGAIAGYNGDAVAATSIAFQILDAPSYTIGDTIRYTLYVRGYTSAYPIGYNQGRGFDSDSTGRWTTPSVITVQEIAQ